MSEQSSVKKKTNAIIDDWRTLKLSEDLNETEIKKLNLFFTVLHMFFALPKFSRFKHNSEPSATRSIRPSSEVFGPRGDEKNGARQQWLAYLSLKNKFSKMINYRGNRFNNLSTGAAATLYHSEDMIDFISNYLDSPNDKLLSVFACIKCSDVLSHVSANALASMIFGEPFLNFINSDEHYLDLYKYGIPLRDRLEQCSREINILDYEVIPNLYEQYPHGIIQQVFDKCFLK